VLVKNCYLSVNDDAIELKGGKGPFADQDPNNGGNRNIIIEDNKFGFCHSALTCGSESVHNYNIVLRNCTVENAHRLLWLKMRPDTPQKYEYILVENISGNAKSMIFIKPWNQFFDLKGEKEIRKSSANNIVMRNINFEANALFDIDNSNQYDLSAFTFENIDVVAKTKTVINDGQIKNLVLRNVNVKQ